MIEIKNSITFPAEFVLITPTRRLVKSSEFKIYYKKQSFKGTVFFFNDLLLFTKKHIFDEKITMKAHFSLLQCIVADLSSKIEKKEFWFSVVNRDQPDSPIEIAASSFAEKREWMDAIRHHTLTLLKSSPATSSTRFKKYRSGTVNLNTVFRDSRPPLL
eukprot:TRINITY_DN3643_c0_g1_i1.p1 TRINITY_DN3643_c0_g1~~TRINITY_DN3643_c0_g1_i1.p1  ORF type:complete len:159 (+),score=21.98 TRINITY_DN3643_c0_g1_i1:211-687(+)